MELPLIFQITRFFSTKKLNFPGWVLYIKEFEEEDDKFPAHSNFV